MKTYHYYKYIFLVLYLLMSFNFSNAQDNKSKLESMTREEIMNMTTDELLALSFEDLLFLSNKLGVSIDELLKMKTTVASKTELTPRETPGIITVISEEEIKNSGARDLMDILQYVPGFDFEYDVDGVVGLGMRGNWVHEGKSLILIDGMMMNDLLYYNVPFANHFSVSNIKQIEIIRGPGSAIYGGNAELCVINIITKKGEDLNGIEVGTKYGKLPRNLGRTDNFINLGMKKGNFDFSFKSNFGRSNLSDQLYQLYYDTTEQQIIYQDFKTEGSKIENANFNISLRTKKIDFNFLLDNYKVQYNYEGIYFNEFRNIASNLKYIAYKNDKIEITPFYSYQYNIPYFTVDAWRNFYITRNKGGIQANYNLTERFNILGGAELYQDNGNIHEDTGYFYNNLSKNLTLKYFALYGQVLYKLDKLNFVVGSRFENNNIYGSAFAPRVGVTSILDKFHFKILASEAFRSPSIGNIDVGTDINIEKTLVLETEIGYKLNDHNFITGNIYDISINDPIVYYDYGGDAIPITDWGYKNSGNGGSTGVELEYKYRYHWSTGAINYSYYTVKWKAIPENYKIDGKDDIVLGLPQYKISMQSTFNIKSNLHVIPGIIYNSEKYGNTDYAIDGESIDAGKINASLQLNLSVKIDNLFTKGLFFEAGCFNISNKTTYYIQPYQGGYPKYPGRGREFIFSLIYKWNDF